MTRFHHLSRSIAVDTISAADPVVVTTTTDHGLVEGGMLLISGVVGDINTIVHNPVRGNPQPVNYTVVSDTTFSLQDVDGTDLDTTGLTYTSGGTVLMDDPLIEWDNLKAITFDPIDVTQGYDKAGVGLTPALIIAIDAKDPVVTGAKDVQLTLYSRPSPSQEWRLTRAAIGFGTTGLGSASWLTLNGRSVLHLVDEYALPNIQFRSLAVGLGTNQYKVQVVTSG